jgi:hypothetical protein
MDVASGSPKPNNSTNDDRDQGLPQPATETPDFICKKENEEGIIAQPRCS